MSRRCRDMCCVSGCNQKRGQEGPLFGFPSDMARSAQWALALNQEEISVLTTDDRKKLRRSVCFRHFEPHLYDNSSHKRVLIKDAVPTLLLQRASSSGEKRLKKIEVPKEIDYNPKTAKSFQEYHCDDGNGQSFPRYELSHANNEEEDSLQNIFDWTREDSDLEMNEAESKPVEMPVFQRNDPSPTSEMVDGSASTSAFPPWKTYSRRYHPSPDPLAAPVEAEEEVFNFEGARKKLERINVSVLSKAVLQAGDDVLIRKLLKKSVAMEFCDVTLVCGPEGRECEAHRAVLSVLSPYFQMILTGQEQSKHSVIIMPDHEYEDIVNVIQFLYLGSVTLPPEEITHLQETLADLGFSKDVIFTDSIPSNILTADGYVSDPVRVGALAEEKLKLPSTAKRKTDRKEYWRLRTLKRRAEAAERKKTKVHKPKRAKRSRDYESEDDGIEYQDLFNVSEKSDDTDKPSSTKNTLYTECPICQSRMRKYLMSSHLKNEHGHAPDTKVFCCDFCPDIYYDSISRNKHETVHPQSTKICEVCEESMHFRLLSKHSQEHARTIKCRVCCNTVQKDAFQDHVKNNCHSTGFPCEVCGKTYSSVPSLSRHVMDIHSEGKHVCHQCKKTFPTLDEKIEHGKTHKRVRGKNTCSICSKDIYTYFLTHVREHGAQEIEWSGNDLKCPRCPRTFDCMDHTLNHLIGHMDHPRPYECDICFLPSRTFGLLVSHKERMHSGRGGTSAASASCPLCYKKFDSRSNAYKRHLLVHAWEEMDLIETDTDIHCPKCDRVFPFARYAANHYLCHLDNDRKLQYECEKCFLMERSRGGLTQHSRICSGEKNKTRSKRSRMEIDEGFEVDEEEVMILQCEACNPIAVFTNEEDYEVHKSLCHS